MEIQDMGNTRDMEKFHQALTYIFDTSPIYPCILVYHLSIQNSYDDHRESSLVFELCCPHINMIKSRSILVRILFGTLKLTVDRVRNLMLLLLLFCPKELQTFAAC